MIVLKGYAVGMIATMANSIRLWVIVPPVALVAVVGGQSDD